MSQAPETSFCRQASWVSRPCCRRNRSILGDRSSCMNAVRSCSERPSRSTDHAMNDIESARERRPSCKRRSLDAYPDPWCPKCPRLGRPRRPRAPARSAVAEVRALDCPWSARPSRPEARLLPSAGCDVVNPGAGRGLVAGEPSSNCGHLTQMGPPICGAAPLLVVDAMPGQSLEAAHRDHRGAAVPGDGRRRRPFGARLGAGAGTSSQFVNIKQIQEVESNPRGSVNPLAVFKTAALNHSATLPS